MAPRARHVAVAVLVAALAAPAARAVGERMSVLPLRVERLQLNDVNRLNQMVRQRAATRGGFAVEEEQATNEIVEAALKLGLDCDINDVACATRVGKLADVPWVLLGAAVGEVRGRVGLDLRVVDVANGTERRRVGVLVPVDADAQVAAFDELMAALFSTAPLPTLTVVTTPPGADVVINGLARGTTPLATPVVGLAAGEHVVSVGKKGWLTKDQLVHLSAGEQADLQVTLVVDPDAMTRGPSELEVAVPFTAAGVAALVGVAGGVALGVGLVPLLAHERFAADFAAAEQDRSSPGYPDAVRDARAGMDAQAAAWSEWGQPSVIAGSALLVVGAAATAAGVWWGMVVLDRGSDDPSASAPGSTR